MEEETKTGCSCWKSLTKQEKTGLQEEAESLLGAASVISGKAKETVRLRDVSSAITLRYFKTRKAPVQTKQATGVPQHCSTSLHRKEMLIIPNLTFIYSSNVRGRLPGTLTVGLWSQLDPRTAAPKDPFPCQ